MDAASKTGIDDIRELIENSKYSPTSAKFKIFIIDEVHMLSSAAFNAFLKTLEEPPKSAIIFLIYQAVSRHAHPLDSFTAQDTTPWPVA